MENSFFDEILNIIVFLIITAILISTAIFIIDDINANAQEPTTILKAGTYRFNETLADFPTTTGVIYGSIPMSTYGQLGIRNNDGVGEFGLIDEEIISPVLYTEGSGWIADETYSMFENYTLETDTEVDDNFFSWFISNTNYYDVNGINVAYITIDIPTDLQIMENINMDINGFGSTTSNDNVGITALNGDTLGRIRTNDDTFVSFNGIAVTSFDSRRTISTYSYPLTNDVIATVPFTITNGLMLYVWDDTQYYQVAWYNPADELWYVHGDYAIIVPYGQRSTSGIGTLTDGIAISLSITPNLTVDDLGYVELGGFEDTPPYDNIITVADEDAYSTFAMFCNANFISDSEKLSWGIAQHQSGQNLGQSQQLGDNILGQFLQAPIDILDSIVIYTTPNGTAVTLMGVFGALLTLSLVIIFLKLFAGG